MKTPITAIVLTYNESVNIESCLRALEWVDDVAIMDSGSKDGTLELALKTRPDARIFEHPFMDFGDQRNWALDNTLPRHDWILFVDADEFCTDGLAREMDAFIRQRHEYVGGYVAGRNYFMGRWVKHVSLYPVYQLRLLKQGFVRFRKEGHGQREILTGRCVRFKENWRHEWMSKGIDEWIERHNRYAGEEVEAVMRARHQPLLPLTLFSPDPPTRRGCYKRLAARFGFLDPYVRFFYRYVVRGGWIDGRPGFILCKLYFVVHTKTQAGVAARLRQERMSVP